MRVVPTCPVGNILGMQTAPGQCLDYCTSLLTSPLPPVPYPDTPAPAPQDIKELRLLNMAYKAPCLAPDDLTSLSFAAPPWISGLFWGSHKSLEESTNAMSQTHMYVEFCIKICEVLSPLQPKQGLQVRILPLPGPSCSPYSNQNYPCVSSPLDLCLAHLPA